MGKIKKERALSEYFISALELIRSKIFFPSSRIVRFPIYIRGRKYIDFGKNLTTGRGCRLEAFRLEDAPKPPVLQFGSNVQINDNVHICAMDSIKIGNDVLIASHVYISDNSHGSYKEDWSSSPDIPPIQREYRVSGVEIGDRVWIGEGCMIMPGVKIGAGSIIGAHSLVNKDLPPASIAVGNPAKLIKTYNFRTGIWERIKN